MKLIDNILFIEFAELEACDVPRRTILSWDNIKDPTDKRKILIQYDTLTEKYQGKIIKQYGDPYTYVHNKVIKQLLKVDTRAFDYFTTYRTKDNHALPSDYIKQYITSANWLNLIIYLTSTIDGKKALKEYNLSGSKLWDFICSETTYEKERDIAGNRIIKEQRKGFLEIENIDLPYDYQSLLRKIKKYQKEGYSCIVSKKFGNDNSKKVKGELNQSLLLEMIAHGIQFSDVHIADKYNRVANVAGFKPITAVTVGTYRYKNRAILDGYRHGNKVWYDNNGKDIHQNRPSAPLLLINSDDNELDVYFREIEPSVNAKGYKVKNYYYRPVLYLVIDAYNDYVLGYAIGDSNTKDLIKAAYLNAANHIKQLTGGRYFWHEIKTDRWGIDRKKSNDFSQWFSNQARFTPTLLKNSRGKVIETTFKGNWSNKLKELFPTNYSGVNITSLAKNNPDWLDENKEFFPLKEDAAYLVEQFINELRNIKDPQTGKTKQQQWLGAFNSMQDNKKRLITDEQHLMWLGLDHVNQRSGRIEKNTITKSGLTPVFNGQKLIYEIPKERYLDTLGTTVKLKYDPYDFSNILAISMDERLRVVCNSYEKMPMAFADWTDDTPEKLNNLIAEKYHHQKIVRESKEQRQEVLQRARLNAQAVLTAGVLTKEIKHDAERILREDYSELVEVKRGGSILDRM